MGDKTKPPSRKRASQRTAAPAANSPDSQGNKVLSRAKRVSRTKAKKTKEQTPRHVFVESVPPALVAEVFEVAGADDDVIVSSMPPPPEPHVRQPRTLSLPPAPHPPRAAHPPARPAPPPDADALELAPEDFEVFEPSNSNPEIGVALLTPLPAKPRAASVWSNPLYRAWLAVGAIALASGIVMGVRFRAAGSERTMSRNERPHVTAMPSSMSAPIAAPTMTKVSLLASTEPNGASTEPNGASTEPNGASAPTASAETSSAVERPRTEETPAVAEGTPFDTKAAKAALNAAFARAASCRGPDDPGGEVTAFLTYAPSGRVTSATVSGVFAGTPIGDCIATALRGARVPPFSGEHVTVKHTAVLR
jgi:hypothetical protein